jgi:hypothetical protein
MRGHDRPSEGLRPLWRVEPHLERHRDSRQHATSSFFLVPVGLDEGELMRECRGSLERSPGHCGDPRRQAA